MSDLTVADIIGADDLNILTVKVPEWKKDGEPGTVYLRLMTVGERDAYECEWLANKEKGVANFRSKFLARCLCDKDGSRLFTDADVEKLAAKSVAVVDRLFKRAMKHNAMSMADVEELAGNERPAVAAVRNAAGRAPGHDAAGTVPADGQQRVHAVAGIPPVLRADWRALGANRNTGCGDAGTVHTSRPQDRARGFHTEAQESTTARDADRRRAQANGP